MTDLDVDQQNPENHPECPFCQIVLGKALCNMIHTWRDTVAITPLNPVVEGHILIIPRRHVTDFVADRWEAARSMDRASRLARMITDKGTKSFNLITSQGAAATQTVMHLHLHLVPRTEGDGLKLPWTDQQVG